MKKRISIAFCLACLWVICLFATSGFSSIARVPSAFNPFSLTSCISNLSSALLSLMPIAMIALLILNQKKDMAKFSTIILTIFGILSIVTLVLGIIRLFAELPKYDGVMTICHRVFSTLISISTVVLMFLSAKSIKNKQTTKHMKVWNIIIIAATVFYGLLVFICSSYSLTARSTSVISLLTNIVVGFTLYTFPKAIYDYENCEFVTKTKIIIVCIFALSIGLSIVLFGNMNSTSKNNHETDNNSTKCFQCDGLGLVNTGFINFKKCPTCNGNGVIFR